MYILKYLKDNKQIASILCQIISKYFSLDILCSTKFTVFLELCSQKTVCILEQIMSADKYLYIFSCQIEAFYLSYIYNNCFWLIHLPSILGLSSLGCLLNCSVWGNINKNWTSSDLTKKMKWTKKEKNLSHSNESCKHSWGMLIIE